MKYFVDYEIPKSFKIGLDGLERNIPARKHSHNAAWVHLYKNMLQSAGWEDVHVLGNHDTYEGYDAMIFYPGISYAGNINFFFGVDDNVVRRFSRIQDFKGPTFILNHEMPLIGSTIQKRIHNNSTSAKVGNLKLLNLSSGEVQDIKGLPKIHFRNQGGLSEIKVSPNFKDDKTIFFSYTSLNLSDGTNALAVSSASLNGENLENKTKL